jgi:hypothetical protein
VPPRVRVLGVSGTACETEVLISRDELHTFRLHTEFILEFFLVELVDRRPRFLPASLSKNFMGGMRWAD